MAKILCSPSKYVQGAGELKKLGEYAQKYGKKALVLITESGYKRIGDVVNTGFEGYEITPVYEYFNRECSKNEINRLVDIMNEKGCDVVIGIGGGKILDTAKAVAYYKEAPVLICPTIASTDAPCSALSVIYTDAGVFEEYLFLPANPDMVLMDTEIIAKSPVRLTVSGMGDALATYFEARACQVSGATTCAGGQVTQAAIALAKLCFDTLMAEGVKAKLALEAGACTPAVEKVIEANTLLSGIGFESGGLAGAHAIHNGFPCRTYVLCQHLFSGTEGKSITRDAVTGRQSDFSYPIPRDGAEEPGNGLSAKAYRWNAARCMPVPRLHFQSGKGIYPIPRGRLRWPPQNHTIRSTGH